jgi:hypothetical protein
VSQEFDLGEVEIDSGDRRERVSAVLKETGMEGTWI